MRRGQSPWFAPRCRVPFTGDQLSSSQRTGQTPASAGCSVCTPSARLCPLHGAPARFHNVVSHALLSGWVTPGLICEGSAQPSAAAGDLGPHVVPQCHEQASSRTPTHATWMGMDDPPPLSPGIIPGSPRFGIHHSPYDALPRVPFFLCHWLHSLDSGLLFVCQNWNAPSVRQSRAGGAGSWPGAQHRARRDQTHVLPPFPTSTGGSVMNRAKEGARHGPKPAPALPACGC